MPVSRRFVKVAGICFMISAATTLVLIFFPRFFSHAPDAAGRAALIFEPMYVARRWVAFVHPLIVLVGALGVLAVRFRESAGAALAGFVFYMLWSATEGIQQALTIVALDWTWRRQFAAAATDARRAALQANMEAFEPLSDGLFFFLLIAFIVANALYLVAVWGRPPLQRVVATGFGLAAGLGIVSLLTTFGGDVVPPAVMAVLYPSLQPAARLITGVWLFRSAEQTDWRP